MNPFSKCIARLTLSLTLSAVGCSRSTPEASKPGARTFAPPSVSVSIAQVEMTTLRPLLDLVGVIVAIPEKTAVISPQLGGWVGKLDVVEGQSVRVGQRLVELDPRSSQVAVRRAEATVAEKSAMLSRLKHGYLPEEIAGARLDAANAAATVEALTNELHALKDLLDRNELSRVVFETKAEAAKSADAALASAQEKVKLLEAGTRPESLAEAQSLLDAAHADLDQAKLALEWCSITSPVDGVVVQLLARQGQFFDRAVSLATVIDLSEVFVQVRIPNSQFTKVHDGTPIAIELSSIPNKTFEGQITRISGQADPATGNVIVFATVKNAGHLLLPGLSCRVHVSLPEVADAIVVPVAAVADNSGTPVVTIIRDSKAYETEVELGVETSDHVQVLSGVRTGERVTIAGGYGLPDGCPVTIVSGN